MHDPSPPEIRFGRINLPLRRASDRGTITVAVTPRIRQLADGKSVIEWRTAVGQLHRDPREGPALITLYPTGNTMEECYCFHDRCHRENGPAVIEYAEDGTVRAEEHWLHGFEISRCRHDRRSQDSYKRAATLRHPRSRRSAAARTRRPCARLNVRSAV